MAETHIPLVETKIMLFQPRPEWAADIDPVKNWSVLPHKVVDGKQVYRLAAFNPNLGKNGVMMSVIEKPELFHEHLSNLNTWEILFDDFDDQTKKDAFYVGLINLEEATGLTQEQLTEILTNKEHWEEIAEKYAQKFVDLQRGDIDIAELFKSDDGVETMVNFIFSDLVETVQQHHNETIENILNKFKSRNN